MKKEFVMKKILIIEDNIELRDQIVYALQLEGYQIYTADNGVDGLCSIKENAPDLILCDIMMPEMNGYDVIKNIRKNKELLPPFIFVTALSERRDFRKGMEGGADDYLVKPFSIQELLRAIQTQFAKSEALEYKIKRTIYRIESEFRKESAELEKKIEQQKLIVDQVSDSKVKLKEELHERQALLMQEALRTIELNTTLKDLAKQLDQELSKNTLSDDYRETLVNLKNRIRSKSGLLNNWTIFQMKFDLLHPELRVAVMKKHPNLTEQERLILSGIYSNLNTNQMAEILCVQASTIRKYKYRLKRKIGLSEREQILPYSQEIATKEKGTSKY